MSPSLLRRDQQDRCWRTDAVDGTATRGLSSVQITLFAAKVPLARSTPFASRTNRLRHVSCTRIMAGSTKLLKVTDAIYLVQTVNTANNHTVFQALPEPGPAIQLVTKQGHQTTTRDQPINTCQKTCFKLSWKFLRSMESTSHMNAASVHNMANVIGKESKPGENRAKNLFAGRVLKTGNSRCVKPATLRTMPANKILATVRTTGEVMQPRRATCSPR